MEVHRPEKRSALATPKQACACPGRDVTYRAYSIPHSPSDPLARVQRPSPLTLYLLAFPFGPSRAGPEAFSAHYLDRGTGLSSPALTS